MLTNLTKFLNKRIPSTFSSFRSCYYFTNTKESSSSTTTVNISEPFETFRKEELKRLYSLDYEQKIPGYATPEATKKYSLRNNKGKLLTE